MKRQAVKPSGRNKAAQAVKSSSKVSKITYQQVVEKLVSLGKRQGFVTYEQINNSLPPHINSSEKIEELITVLNEKNVEITSGPIQKAVEPPLEDTKALELKREKELEEEREVVEDYERVRMDDPVRMYLRQMGQIPLLKRDEEVELAKRIEEAEEHVKEAAYQMKAARIEVLKLVNQIQTGEASLESIIEEDHEDKLTLNKRKLKVLARRLRASRKSSNHVELLMQFNLNIAIVQQTIASVRAKLEELIPQREEVAGLLDAMQLQTIPEYRRLKLMSTLRILDGKTKAAFRFLTAGSADSWWQLAADEHATKVAV